MIKVFLITLSLLLISQFANAYVMGKTKSGLNLKWNLKNNQLTVFVDSTSNLNNSFNLEQNEIDEIILNSINQWNDKTVINLNANFNNTNLDIGKGATIRFSENSAFFGQGVLAVTSISHDPSSGEIWSADILINESTNNLTLFTRDPALSSGSSFAFLGDVVTHEMGHLLGLGHSEVIGSSMLYSVFKGQYDIASDDIAGINYLYSIGENKKVYRGKVTSGDGGGIFGANVQVILQSTGEVYMAQMTDQHGYFYLKDLPENDYFLIYVAPPRSISNLPSFFGSIQSNTCNGKSYKASFFSQCGGRNQSRPQVFSTSFDYEQIYIDVDDYYNKTLKFDWNDRIFDLNYYNDRKNFEYYYDSYEVYNLGEVTIRCKEPLDPSYILNKYQSNTSFDLYEFDPLEFEDFYIAGDTFTGSFSNDEIATGVLGKGDVLHLDYRHFTGPSNHFLDLKISTESLGSMLKLVVKIKNLVTNETTIYQTDQDDITGRNILNFNIQHPLKSDANENDFEITLVPEDESIFSEADQKEILAVPDVLKNPENTYLLMFTIGYDTDNGYTTFPIKQFRFPKDNKYCREGNSIVSARPNITEAVSITHRDDIQGVSCATIDMDGGNNGSGPLSFVIGLGIILLLASLKETRFKILSK